MEGPWSSQKRERRKKARSEGFEVKVVVISTLLRKKTGQYVSSGDEEIKDTYSTLSPRDLSVYFHVHKTVSA